MNRRLAKYKIRDNLNKNEGIEVTESLVLHWWGFLNSFFFSGALDPPEIKICRMRGYFGECECLWKEGKIVTRLGISSHIKNKSLLIGTVGHEMIHAKQYMDTGRMNHSVIFNRYKKEFKKFNINI